MTRKPVVLIATGARFPDIGGPATYTKLLEEGLPGRGFRVLVASFGSVRRYPPLLRHVLFARALLALGRDADVIYALDPFSAGLPALLAARALKKRFVLRVAGDYAWEQGVQRFGVRDMLDEFAPRRGGYHPAVLLMKRLQLLAARGAETVVVPSAYLRRIVAAWGVPERKIVVIESVIEPLGDQGRKEDLRELLSFDGEFVLSAGRLVPWKGFAVLVKLMPEILRSFPRLKLVIAGSGPDESKLRGLIEDLGLEENVVLAGALPRIVLFKYLKAADLFVLNTAYEGLSHQILEAMAVGTPVVATAVGGNPELIRDGKDGVLVPYGDARKLSEAIRALLADRKRAEALAASARERVRRFSKDAMLRKLAAVLASTR